ncbi:hypothetical protein EI94DRAFT_1785914 [Lactarius quietus]|nr:hypothetical protein EI94DRAFT_1785914 [Lactarius quietus]
MIDVDGDAGGEDTISEPSTEPADDNYEAIKAMADANNEAATFKPQESVKLMYASSFVATRSTSIQTWERLLKAIGACSVGATPLSRNRCVSLWEE